MPKPKAYDSTSSQQLIRVRQQLTAISAKKQCQRCRILKATRERKKQRRMGRDPVPSSPPASETAALPEAEELEEIEESLPTRAEVNWDEASTDGEESEEELEMTGRR